MNTDNEYSDLRLRLQIESFIQRATLGQKYTNSPDDVIRAVCEEYGMTCEELMMNCRRREYVEPRQIAHKILKGSTNMPLEQIGLMVGRKGHATVLYSIRSVNNLYETDPEYRKRVNRILSKLCLKQSILTD